MLNILTYFYNYENFKSSKINHACTRENGNGLVTVPMFIKLPFLSRI